MLAQCLAQEPGLVDYMLSERYKRHENPINKAGTGGQMAGSLAALLKLMWSGKYLVVDPSAFMSVASKHNPDLRLYAQQDCHEFLQWLMLSVHEDVNEAKSVSRGDNGAFVMRPRSRSLTPGAGAASARGGAGAAGEESDDDAPAAALTRSGSQATVETARSAWREHSKRDSSFVVDRCWAMLTDRLHCTTCGTASDKFESGLFVLVTVPPTFVEVHVTIVREIRPADALASLQHWVPQLVGSSYAAARDIVIGSLLRASPPSDHPAAATPGTEPLVVRRFSVPSTAPASLLLQRVREVQGFPEESTGLVAWYLQPQSHRPVTVDSHTLCSQLPGLVVSAYARRPAPGTPAAAAWSASLEAERRSAAPSTAGTPPAAGGPRVLRGSASRRRAGPASAATGFADADDASESGASGDCGPVRAYDLDTTKMAVEERLGASLWVRSVRPCLRKRRGAAPAARAAVANGQDMLTAAELFEESNLLDGLPMMLWATSDTSFAAGWFLAMEWARLCYTRWHDPEEAEAEAGNVPAGLRRFARLPATLDKQLVVLPQLRIQRSDSMQQAELQPDQTKFFVEDGADASGGVDLLWTAERVHGIDILWRPSDDGDDADAADAEASAATAAAAGPKRWLASLMAQADKALALSRTYAAAVQQRAEEAFSVWEKELSGLEAEAAHAMAEHDRLLADAGADEAEVAAAAMVYRSLAIAAEELRDRQPVRPQPVTYGEAAAVEQLEDVYEHKDMKDIALTPPARYDESSDEEVAWEARQRGFESADAMRDWCSSDRPGQSITVPLENCLRLLTAPEAISEEMGWKCSSCKAVRAASKRHVWWDLPDVLVLPLQRSQHIGASGLGKNSTTVRYPLDLDMGPWLDPAAPDAKDPARTRYELFAVACHVGTLAQGHYTAIVRSALTGEWWSLDDGRVTSLVPDRADDLFDKRVKGHAMTEEEQRIDSELHHLAMEASVQRNSAYILFYRRVGSDTPAVANLRATLGLAELEATDAGDAGSAASGAGGGDPEQRIRHRSVA